MILQNLNNIINNNITICSDLEAVTKLLYDFWFVQFDFPDENGKPYKSSGGKMVWNEELKREIPAGWVVKKLCGLYKVERGISYSSDDIASGVGLPMINLACIDKRRNYRDGELKYFGGKLSDEAYLAAGDLLIACTDLTREREIIGCPILVPDDGSRYTYSMDMAKISFPSADINDLYMYMALRTDYYHNYIKAWASGTNVLHLNLEGLDWYTLCIPPIELQNRFASIIKTYHSKISGILVENKRLTALRDFLLQWGVCMSNIDEKWFWGIHTYDDNLFLNEGVIAVGWKEFGDLSRFPADREAIKTEYAKSYPNEPKGSIPTCVGMLYRFCFEVKDGDYVVYPSKIDKMINIGIDEGPYYFDSAEEKYPQKHKVKWIKSLPRTAFSQGALHEVGSALSFFTVRNYADEFIAALDKDFVKKVQQKDEEDETVAATADEIIQSTKDFILKELFRQLKGYDLEDFVGNLLEAMGYRVKISPHGGDSGVDIVAYKDELPPRILVQVKSTDGNITEQTIMSLKGAMREGDYGLFVTLSHYTKNAQKYLANTPIIRGMDGDELVGLILKYYDQLDEKYQKMIPLKMVYIPVAKEE